MEAPVKFGDSSPNGSRVIQQRSRQIRHFRPFFKRTVGARGTGEIQDRPIRCPVHGFLLAPYGLFLTVLPLDEAIASRAVFVVFA